MSSLRLEEADLQLLERLIRSEFDGPDALAFFESGVQLRKFAELELALVSKTLVTVTDTGRLVVQAYRLGLAAGARSQEKGLGEP